MPLDFSEKNLTKIDLACTMITEWREFLKVREFLEKIDNIRDLRYNFL